MSIAKGSVFCLPQHLESDAADVSGRLAAADRLRAWPATVHHRAGRVLADVDALHPFREGNGRALRAFFSQLARDAGPHIAWCAWTPTAARPRAPLSTAATWPRSGKCPAS